MKRREQEMKRHEEDMKRHDADRKKHDQAVKAIESELAKDGFSKNGNYQFKMTNAELWINKEKQPQAVFEKYFTIYNTNGGSPLKSPSATIQLIVNNN